MKAWKWLTVIIILALLAGYYIFGTGLLKENRRNRDLTAQVNSQTGVLATMPSTTGDTEARLSAARADMTAAENTFYGETNDTRIVNYVLRLAETNGVIAIPLSTLPWTIEQIEGNEYSVFYMTFSVTGDFLHLQDFIGGLGTSEINTLGVKKLHVTRDSTEPGDNITADIDIAVYTLVSRAE
jgi:hypothetical protein